MLYTLLYNQNVMLLEQYIRYKWDLQSIFDELAIDLPSVFDRFSPYALIFPSEKAMRSLLTIINNEIDQLNVSNPAKLKTILKELYLESLYA